MCIRDRDMTDFEVSGPKLYIMYGGIYGIGELEVFKGPTLLVSMF